MAQFIDLNGLTTYDNKIKEYIDGKKPTQLIARFYIDYSVRMYGGQATKIYPADGSNSINITKGQTQISENNTYQSSSFTLQSSLFNGLNVNNIKLYIGVNAESANFDDTCTAIGVLNMVNDNVEVIITNPLSRTDLYGIFVDIYN